MPGQSTLLQVFVSIQSMIFCDEPWYNEPGRENQPNDAASRDYNVRIQSLTIPYALVDWLCKPNPIWQEVVEKHFATHGDEILSIVKGWGTKAMVLQQQCPTQPRPPSVHYHTHIPGTSSRLPRLIAEFENALKSARGTRGDSKRKQPEGPSEDQDDGRRVSGRDTKFGSGLVSLL